MRGLRLIEMLNDKEQEKCRTSTGLSEVLSDKFKPQYNEILSLQYWKLVREQKENSKEWMAPTSE